MNNRPRCENVNNLFLVLFTALYWLPVSSQTVTGDQLASPSANVSTSTTGGTNINYQTNNQYNNEFGFAPGIFCRTPTIVLGAGAGQLFNQVADDPFNVQIQNPVSNSYQSNLNLNANIGLVIPIGSSVIEDCKALARQIAMDRRISTELSMIRACNALAKEGISVDPVKYPLLAKCATPRTSTTNSANQIIENKVQIPTNSPKRNPL